MRFRAFGRYVRRTKAEKSFRRHPNAPRAAIVVEAETHEQLDEMLLALNRALERYAPAEVQGEHSVKK